MSLPNRDRLTDLGKNLLITKRERWGPRGNNWLILTYAPCYLYNNPQTNCMTQGSYSTVCNKLYGKRTSNGTSLYNWIKLLYIGKENKQTQECNSPTNFNSNYTWKQNKQTNKKAYSCPLRHWRPELMSDLWSPSSLGSRLGSPVSEGAEESILACVASHPLMDPGACDLFTSPRPPGPAEEASPLRPGYGAACGLGEL